MKKYQMFDVQAVFEIDMETFKTGECFTSVEATEFSKSVIAGGQGEVVVAVLDQIKSNIDELIEKIESAIV